MDGRTATIRPKIGAGTGFSFTLTDVELFQLHLDGYTGSTTYTLSDFISQQTMAEQAIVAGPSLRWNAAQPLGSAATVSFSFVNAAPASGVGATGFRAFTATEQQLVRDILAKTSALAGINFTEVADNGANFGQIRLGVSQQTATKGVSWLPNQTGAGDLAGDVWMDIESMVGIVTGTEGYAALLHEIGHALGLRHPRNVDAGDSWATQLRTVDDRTALSVMSSVSSSDGLFRADWGPLDVLALRYLYGSRDVGMGNNSYILGHAQAASQTTIIDAAGTDTLDASAYSTGVNLNLMPGGLSSVGFTAAGSAGVENLSLGAGTWIENAIGSAFDDVLIGNDLDNRLTGGLGNDWIEGGKGVDTAVFAGNLADYILSYNFGKNFVEARDGVSGFDTLISIERLEFSDFSVALDVSGNPGTPTKSVNALPTGSVTVTGIATQGQTLTVANTLTDLNGLGAITYQWRATGSPISGATGTTFILTQDQVGKTITVAASYTDGFGTPESVTSIATGTVGKIINGTVGNDTLDGDTGIDTAVWNGPASNFGLTFANGTWQVHDNIGGEGTDTVTNVERLQFANKTVITESQAHGSYNDLPEALWHFFIVAFNAAPGVEYMNQLAEAYLWFNGKEANPVKTIVDIFTTRHQFTDVYPTSLSNADMASALVANIVKNSATTAAKNEAINDIKTVLDRGWSMGDVVYTVFGNLATKPLSDPTWGNTAKQFNNQIAVAKYYTEVMNQSTTDLATLRTVIHPVNETTDVSSGAQLVTLVGVALMEG